MEHASYTKGSDYYTIVLIKEHSVIDTDIDVVKDLIGDMDLKLYRAQMAKAVDQGLAYAIYKNGDKVGFVYNRLDNGNYVGCSIHITDITGVLVALKTMFELADKPKIQFVPHSRQSLMNFLSWADGYKIRAFNNGNPTLVIMRDYIEPKAKKMFDYLNIKQVAWAQ